MEIKIEDWVEVNREKFIEISNTTWKYAELGLFEEKSSELHARILEEAGFNVIRGIAGLPTAVMATCGTEKPVIGILGEYDALPGLSQQVEPVKNPVNEGAPGHGCGHNLYGAACLAASIVIKEKIENRELKGTVRYYGCPAEENADGKGWMVKAGLFDDVDVSLTWHPWDANYVLANNFQAMFNVVFQFKGRTAHAAGDPFNGRSALDAVELMNVGCNYLREHIISDARLHYVITKGGEAPNIVPAEAEVWYYVRAPQIAQVKEIYARVIKIAEGAALMTETEVEVILLGGSSNLLSNTVLEDLMLEKMKAAGAPLFTNEDQKFAQEIRKTFPEGFFDNLLTTLPQDGRTIFEQFRNKEFCDVVLPIFGRGTTLGGSTDVGDVSWVTPLAQFAMACSAIGTPGHSWQFVSQAGMSIGHKGMLQAAKVLGLAAAELMESPELVRRARQEFEEKLQKTPYTSPLPDEARPPIDYFKRVYMK
ncbi:MAG: amidohydrolase [Candidatus Odinarchaeota archaeon]